MSWTSGSLMGSSRVGIRPALGLQTREEGPPEGPDDAHEVVLRKRDLAVRGELARIVLVGIDVVTVESVAADMGQLGESVDEVPAQGADELAIGAGPVNH